MARFEGKRNGWHADAHLLVRCRCRRAEEQRLRLENLRAESSELFAFEVAQKTVPIAPVSGFLTHYYFRFIEVALGFASVSAILRQPFPNVPGNSVFRGFG